MATIHELEEKIKKLNIQNREDREKMKNKHDHEIEDKNNEITSLENEVSRLSMEEKIQKEIWQQKEQRELELDSLLKSER